MISTAGRTMDIRVFHRKIALRICLTGLTLAVIFGGITWYTQKRSIMSMMTDQAIRDALQVNSRISLSGLAPDQDPAVLEKELGNLISSHAKHTDESSNRIFFVALFNPDHSLITSAAASDELLANDLKKDPGILTRILESPRETPRQLLSYKNVPFVLVSTPLSDNENKIKAYAKSAVRFSPQAMKNAGNRVLILAFSVFGIVLVTTLILYPVIINLTHRLGRLTLNLLHSNMETLEILGNAVAKRDSETASHNYRVTLYAVRLAEMIGLDPMKIQGLIKGAFLHDVGKIGVGEQILMKPGRLDEHEFETVKSHVNQGLDIVNRSEWLDDANQVVAYHHEKFDGSGYFAGLKGEEIPLIARVFAIADVFDTLTSQRPYKDPVSFNETMAILEREKGLHFDPELVDKFSQVAEDLYHRYSGKNDDYLKEVLTTIRERYFRRHTVFH